MLYGYDNLNQNKIIKNLIVENSLGLKICQSVYDTIETKWFSEFFLFFLLPTLHMHNMFVIKKIFLKGVF